MITSFGVSGVRNLNNCQIAINSPVVFFLGNNGAGKTSILEALYILSAGKSFRAKKLSPVVSFAKESLIINAAVLHNKNIYTLGIERNKSSNIRGRAVLQGAESSTSVIAKYLPLQIFDMHSSELLYGAPDCRRSFLDWGVFHVEHSMLANYKSYRTCLKQRNFQLKSMKQSMGRCRAHQVDALRAFNQSFVASAQAIDSARKRYLQHFQRIFQGVIKDLLPGLEGLAFEYNSGWDWRVDSLTEALERSIEADLSSGFTQVGPHRAELTITVSDGGLKNILSRGQQKLFVMGMYIARCCLLMESGGNCGGLLIDDLMAELDSKAAEKLLSKLYSLGAQLFITGTEECISFVSNLPLKKQIFLVKSGKISSFVHDPCF